MPRAWRTEKFFVLRRLLQREDRDTREPRHLNPRAPAGGPLTPPGEAAHRGRLFAGRHQFVHEGVETLHIVHYTFGPCPRMTRYTTADTAFPGCTSTRTLWRQVAQQCSWATPSTGGATAAPRPSQTARRNGRDGRRGLPRTGSAQKVVGWRTGGTPRGIGPSLPGPGSDPTGSRRAWFHATEARSLRLPNRMRFEESIRAILPTDPTPLRVQ